MPKHLTSSRKIGVTDVEINDPRLMAKQKSEKKIPNCFACCGSVNCSPPNAATHGFMPPEPNAIKPNPTIVKALKNHFLSAFEELN